MVAIRETPAAVDVSPSAANSRYGAGVLSSADFVAGSHSLSSVGLGTDGQRILSCSVTAMDLGGDFSYYDEDGNLIAFDPGGAGGGFPVPEQGSCTQRVSGVSAGLEVTFEPRTSLIPRRGTFNLTVSIRNRGDAPIAILARSIAAVYESPAGHLSGLWLTSVNGLFSVGFDGEDLDDQLDVYLQGSDEATVIQPGDEMRLAFEGLFADPSRFEDLPDEYAMTDEEIQASLRDSSAIGELSREDPVAQAFLDGEYAPRGGLLVQLAPTEDDDSAVVFLLAIVDAVGEMPETAEA